MQSLLFRNALCVLLASMIFISCDTSLDGNLNENMPPRTSLTVDNIQVDEQNRLSSRVDISWWGVDPDGFIIGYEFAISDTSEGNWSFTSRTDSTFILPISPGEETDDVLFAVRAIDNENAVDPVGASIRFPLRNSPPVTELNTLELPPDTTFGLFSFGWSISDPDGRPTILRTEIALNDTTNGWTEIPFDTEDQENLFITLVIQDQTAETTTADLYLGRSFRSTELVIEGVRLNQNNTFYARTVDRALAESEIQEFDWYLKRQNSNILILNDDSGLGSQEKLQFHIQNLDRLGFTADILDISGGEGLQGGIVPLSSSFPRVIEPTLNRALAQWDHIYFISNSLNRNLNYAPEILNRFFENGGTLFAAVPVTRPNDDTRLEDPLFQFIPISGFVDVDSNQGEVGFRIDTGAEINSVNGGPLLIYTGTRNTSIWPFEPLTNASGLYEGEFRRRIFTGSSVPHDGISTISVLNPDRNFLYFGMDLTNLDVDGAEDSEDISELLEELLINRLGFIQQ